MGLRVEPERLRGESKLLRTERKRLRCKLERTVRKKLWCEVKRPRCKEGLRCREEVRLEWCRAEGSLVRSEEGEVDRSGDCSRNRAEDGGLGLGLSLLPVGLRLRLGLRLGLILRLSLLPLGQTSSSLGFLVSSEMFSTSCRHLWSLLHWEGGSGHGDVGAGHTETVDVIGDVVDSLYEAVSVDILISPTSDSEGVLGLSLGRVDVLVTKAELTELILCMELAGWGLNGGLDGGLEWGLDRTLEGGLEWGLDLGLECRLDGAWEGGWADKMGFRGKPQWLRSECKLLRCKRKRLRWKLERSRDWMNEWFGDWMKDWMEWRVREERVREERGEERGDGSSISCVQGNRGHWAGKETPEENLNPHVDPSPYGIPVAP
jgi:hypothetical protein